MKLGEYDFNQAGETGDETFGVAEMRLHAGYNDQTYENDIAIIRLDRPATFSDSIWPICLPDGSRDFTNSRAFVIGEWWWGVTQKREKILNKVGTNLESEVLKMVFSLLRLGHDIFRRADERDAAGGECARVGAGRVRHQLRHAGPRRAGHDALRRRDQQGLLPGRLGRPPQLCQSQHQQVGARAVSKYFLGKFL